MKLNLGCGEDYKQGWINLDSRDNIKTDVKHDLEKFPYPFKPNTFEEVYVSHVLEHLNDPIKALKELVRISKNNGKIIVKVPHATSYSNFSSIQHKSSFVENSFTQRQLKDYELEQLKLVKQEFSYPNNKWKKYIPFKKYLKIFLNGLYDDLYFEFVVKKS